MVSKSIGGDVVKGPIGNRMIDVEESFLCQHLIDESSSSWGIGWSSD